MSADNWTICPKCWAEQDEDYDADTKAAELESDIAAFAKRHNAAPALVKELRTVMLSTLEPGKPDDTLREDYELGIRDGLFFLTYRAYCTKCNWQYKREIKGEPV